MSVLKKGALANPTPQTGVRLGDWSAATNTPTLPNPPTSPAYSIGDYYTSTDSGTFAGFNFTQHDKIVVIPNGTVLAWNKETGGAVDSVFGRVGDVEAQSGDYLASQITNTPAGGIAAITVQAAITELDSEKVAGPASAPDKSIPRYNTTTGKLIQDSDILIDDDNNLILSETEGGVISESITINSSGGSTVINPNTTVSLIQVEGTLTHTLVFSELIGYSSDQSKYIEIQNSSTQEIEVADVGGTFITIDPQSTGVLRINGVDSFLSWYYYIPNLFQQTGTGKYVGDNSPALTGSPTAPTQSANDNSTKIATTAYVDSASGVKISDVFYQTFAASGTYTPTAGLLYGIVELWGGGAAGGGVAGSAAQTAGAGGGGAGAYSKHRFTAADIGASQAVTIGAAGAVGTAGNNPGGNGGTTSLGALCTAPGGTGGGGAPGNGGGVGGLGGVAGTANMIAAAGANGFTGNGAPISTGSYALAGQGASSSIGGGGIPVQTASTQTGTAATGKAAGGGGGAVQNSAGTVTGGVGTIGYMVITEYLA